MSHSAECSAGVECAGWADCLSRERWGSSPPVASGGVQGLFYRLLVIPAGMFLLPQKARGGLTRISFLIRAGHLECGASPVSIGLDKW